MTDIVERLKRPALDRHGLEADTDPTHDVRHEAADEIERLRAALTRLVAWEGPVELACPELGGLLKAMYDARAALDGK